MANIIRLVISAVLLLGGLSKLLALAEFRRVLRDFQTVPSWLVATLGIAIPTAEFALGAWLVLAGRRTNVAAGLAGGLFVVFGAGIAKALGQGCRLECGCFGRLSRNQATWWTVGRDAALAAGATFVAIRFDTAPSRVGTGVPALLAVAAMVVGMTLAAEALSAWRLPDTLRRPPVVGDETIPEF